VPLSIPIAISLSGDDFSSMVVSLQDVTVDAGSVILHLKDKKFENFLPKQ
jgi:hypothetical protein